MVWSDGSSALNQIPSSLANIISKSVQHSENLLVDVDRTFHIDSEYTADILAVLPNLAAVIKEEEFGVDTPLNSADFIPIPGVTRYKLEKREGNLSINGSYAKEEDGDASWEMKFDRIIPNSSKLHSLIVDNFPSLDRRTDDGDAGIKFCAIVMRGDYCDILGVYQIDNGPLVEDEDVWSTNDGVDLIASSIHETASDLSKFRVTVHSSIFDRVADEDISIPISFLNKEDGALEYPMHVSLSKKICKEMQIISDIEFCIFRDRDHLFFSSAAPNVETSLIRIPFSMFTNSQGRVNTQKIRTALSKEMALKRDKSGVSSSSFNRKFSGWENSDEKIGTRIGLGLKIRTMNTTFEDASGPGGKWKIQFNNADANLFYKVIPLMLHLCLARFDPSLRGEIRIKSEPKGLKRNQRKSMKKTPRLFDWGTDSVRYISEGEGTSRSRHWVNPHVRKISIKDPKTIRYYESRDFPIIRDNNGVIGFRIIRGHYRGTAGADWNGDYKFGKSPSYYSLKAIGWLRSIEEEQGVSIQHAEKGGELRIEIGESYIQVDGWCEKTNTVYEFHGDVYHGNPTIYSEEDLCHPYDKSVTAGELYEKTMQKENAITSRGFNLVTMWESDWDKIESGIIDVLPNQRVDA